MKAKDIQVGKCYRAKVSNQITTVRVRDIIHGSGISNHGISRPQFVCVNLATGREITVKSAQRFRSEAGSEPAKPAKIHEPRVYCSNCGERCGTDHKNDSACCGADMVAASWFDTNKPTRQNDDHGSLTAAERNLGSGI